MEMDLAPFYGGIFDWIVFLFVLGPSLTAAVFIWNVRLWCYETWRSLSQSILGLRSRRSNVNVYWNPRTVYSYQHLEPDCNRKALISARTGKHGFISGNRFSI